MRRGPTTAFQWLRPAPTPSSPGADSSPDNSPLGAPRERNPRPQSEREGERGSHGEPSTLLPPRPFPAAHRRRRVPPRPRRPTRRRGLPRPQPRPPLPQPALVPPLPARLRGAPAGQVLHLGRQLLHHLGRRMGVWSAPRLSRLGCGALQPSASWPHSTCSSFTRTTTGLLGEEGSDLIWSD